MMMKECRGGGVTFVKSFGQTEAKDADVTET